MPHPAGSITVRYERRGPELLAEITLPAGISGDFVWEGKTYALKGGLNRVSAR